jgi:hypothetical protein
VRRLGDDEIDRKRLGLESPRAVLRLDMGSLSYRLTLGKETVSPAAGAYLEIGGDGAPNKGVVIVERELVDELTSDVKNLKPRELVPYSSSALDRIILEGAGGTRRMRRAKWGGWRFDGMHGDLTIDARALDRILLGFARAQADEFIEASVAEAALRKAAKSVRLTLVPRKAEEPKAVLEVGGRCPENGKLVVGIRREPDPMSACLPQSVLGALEISATAMLDRGLFSLGADEIERLVIESGDERLELARNENGFKLRTPRQETDVALEVGNQRLEALASATGTLVDDPKGIELGLEPPVGTMTVTSAAAKEADVQEQALRWGAREADGSLHVQRKQDKAVLRVGPETARLFSADPTLFRGREVWRLATGDIRSIRVRWDGNEQHFLRTGKGAYELIAPKAHAYDATLADDIVETASSLRADRWVSPSDDGSFGLQNPTAVLRVELEDQQQGLSERTLYIGRPASGGAFARVEGDNAVFVIARHDVEVLQTLILDRGVFLIDPQEVARLELATAERRLVLERVGDDFMAVGAELPAVRVQQIVETLSTLRAHAAVSLGPVSAAEGLTAPLLSVRVDYLDDRKPTRWRVGAGDSWRATSVHYARVDGIEATYVLPRADVKRLLDAL